MGKRTKARRRGGSAQQVEEPAAPVAQADPTANPEKATALAAVRSSSAASKGTLTGLTPEDISVLIKNLNQAKVAGATDEEIHEAIRSGSAEAVAPTNSAGPAASTEPATTSTNSGAAALNGTQQSGGWRGGERWGWSLDGDLPGELVGGYHRGKKHNGNKSKKTKRGGKLSYSLLGGRKSVRKSGKKH